MSVSNQILFRFKLLVSVFLLAFGVLARAETIQYQANVDFSLYAEADVFHYFTGKALAVNHAAAETPERFARATAQYEGLGGSYEVAIDTIQSLGGDSEYRLLVNGVFVGRVVNSPRPSYERHEFGTVYIPAEATISIESNAVSSGLVLMSDGTAVVSQGKWTTLTLHGLSQVTGALDLGIEAQQPEDYSNDPVIEGKQFSVDLRVTNTSDQASASNAFITVPVPTLVELEEADSSAAGLCSQLGKNLICKLPNLAAGESVNVSLLGVPYKSGRINLKATVISDELDYYSGNNVAKLPLDVVDKAVLVDLQLSISPIVKKTLEPGEEVTHYISVKNIHPYNTAVSPSFYVLDPFSLSLNYVSGCISISGIKEVRYGWDVCSLKDIAPGETVVVTMGVKALGYEPSAAPWPPSPTIYASLNTAQVDANSDDNEAEIEYTINDPVYGDAELLYDLSSSSNGGGGSAFFLGLLVLLGNFGRSGVTVSGTFRAASD